MSEKQYFFRNNEYSNMEMIRRIPIDMLANDVIGENGLSQNKAMKLFLERYKDFPELITKLKQVFETNGRKGDFANILIFDFAKFRYDFLAEDGIDIINNLRGKEINQLPLLASFIEHDKAYFEDIKIITNEYIDYKFRFEYEQIKEVDGQLSKELIYSFVECRHYIKEKVIAVYDSTAYEVKAVCCILYTIPYYINTTRGNELLYGEPDYKQILLNSSQLESVKVLLGGRLKYTILDMISDKGVRVKIEGNDKDFETNSSTLKQNIKNGDKKEVQFFWNDEELRSNKITIKSDCQIISTNYLTEQALKKIIDTIILVDSKREFLIPISSIIEKYCSHSFRKALAKRSVSSKIVEIMDEMREILNKIFTVTTLQFEPSDLYITICLNIMIQSLLCKKVSDCTIQNINIVDTELYKVISVYLKLNNNVIVTASEVNNSIGVLLSCIKKAGIEESKLLDAYYSI
jgi:hypothetical protein